MQPLSLDTLRTLDTSKSYYLSPTTGGIEEASRWQRFKCRLGIGSGREKTARFIEAVKTSLLQSAGMGDDRALSADMAALSRKSMLSGSALAEIATRFSVANADRIATVSAEKIAEREIGAAVRFLTERGACDAAHEPYVRDVLRQAVRHNLAQLPKVQDGGRSVLDSAALQSAIDASMHGAKMILLDISRSAALGNPKIGKFYAEHVKATLWNPDGTRTQKTVADLNGAKAVHLAAAMANYPAAGSQAAAGDTRGVDAIKFAIDACGDDSQALEIVAQNVKGFCFTATAQPRGDESIKAKVASLGTALDELRNLAKDDPGLLRQGSNLLFNLGSDVPPAGMIGALVRGASETRLDSLSKLGPASSVQDVHSAVREFREAVVRLVDETGADALITGGDNSLTVRNFVMNRMLARVDGGVLGRAREVLLSETAKKLDRVYKATAEGAFDRTGISEEVLQATENVGDALRTCLVDLQVTVHRALGMEYKIPRTPRGVQLPPPDAAALKEVAAYAIAKGREDVEAEGV